MWPWPLNEAAMKPFLPFVVKHQLLLVCHGSEWNTYLNIFNGLWQRFCWIMFRLLYLTLPLLELVWLHRTEAVGRATSFDLGSGENQTKASSTQRSWAAKHPLTYGYKAGLVVSHGIKTRSWLTKELNSKMYFWYLNLGLQDYSQECD